MKLFEYQGKDLFKKYGIQVPHSVLLDKPMEGISLGFPVVAKSQVLSGDRKKKGGIRIIETKEQLPGELNTLFKTEIDGALPGHVLVEERIEYLKEWYVSFTYDTDKRCPVIAVSGKGGMGVDSATIVELQWLQGHWGLPSLDAPFREVAQKLLNLFEQEHALLAEINPLFELDNGVFIAGDAKVILDDNVVDPLFRPFLDLPGDIAILASGGGASLINLDALILAGGKPANYVEYSGNPPASIVEELTVKVLSKPGLRGCWTVGGTANFTDIFETLSGFVRGLRRVTPKPTYPIVIRRDGPRQKEAFEMLERIAKEEGYDFHIFGPETPMAESAKIVVQLAYKS
ncbi:MAG: ATP citrate lyase citrate-binding domain-containing protein [bacterium]|nr:ATP citrate lyase citrate-binding domain-containing protein [bacterium]